MEAPLIIGLVVLVLLAAGLVVALEDRREQRRQVARRQAYLARLGEAQP